MAAPRLLRDELIVADQFHPVDGFCAALSAFESRASDVDSSR